MTRPRDSSLSSCAPVRTTSCHSTLAVAIVDRQASPIRSTEQSWCRLVISFSPHCQSSRHGKNNGTDVIHSISSSYLLIIPLYSTCRNNSLGHTETRGGAFVEERQSVHWFRCVHFQLNRRADDPQMSLERQTDREKTRRQLEGYNLLVWLVMMSFSSSDLFVLPCQWIFGFTRDESQNSLRLPCHVCFVSFRWPCLYGSKLQIITVWMTSFIKFVFRLFTLRFCLSFSFFAR